MEKDTIALVAIKTSQTMTCISNWKALLAADSNNLLEIYDAVGDDHRIICPNPFISIEDLIRFNLFDLVFLIILYFYA